MAPPAFRNTATSTGGVVTSRSAAKPTGTALNDILLAFLYVENTATITAPSGWAEAPSSPVSNTASGQSHRLRVYWKRATSSEPSTYAWSWTGSVYALVAVAAYTGCVTSGSPFDTGTGAPTSATATATTGTAAPGTSLTTQGTDRLAVHCVVSYQFPSWTATSGWSGRDTTEILIEDKALASAGATGTAAGTAGAAGAMSAWLGALLSSSASSAADIPAAANLEAAASVGADAARVVGGAAAMGATASVAAGGTRQLQAGGDLVAVAVVGAGSSLGAQVAAPLAAKASLGAAAQATQYAGAALSAKAAIGADGTRSQMGGAELAAHASVTADAARTVTPAAELAAKAAVAASVGDTATIVAKATLAAGAVPIRPASADLVAQAAVGADVTRAQPAAAALAAAATVGADSYREQAIAAALVAAASLGAPGQSTQQVSAALVAAAAVGASATRAQPGAATLVATASLAGAGRTTHQVGAALVATAAVGADVRLTYFVAATATAKATVTVGAVRDRPSVAALAAIASVGAPSWQTNEVAATLAAAAQMLTAGVQSQPLAADMVAHASLGATILRTRLPAAELAALATLGAPIRIRYVDSVVEVAAPPPVPPHPTRVIAQNILTGRWLSWDLPVHDLTVTHNLSGPDVISGGFPSEVHDLRDVDLEPWGTWIYVEEDGVIRASGILQPSSVDENEALTLEAVGVTGYAHGIPYLGEFALSGTDPASGTTGVGINLDPADIVRAIWAHLQSYPDAKLGVQVTGSTPVRIGTPPKNVDFTTGAGDQVQFVAGPYAALNWWQATDCGDEISKLAKETPFDFVERAAWNANKTAVQQFVDLGYPRIGRRRFDLRFAQDENLLAAIGPEETDNLYASQVVLLGKGEGRDKVRGYAGQRLGTRLRRVAVIDDKTVDSTTRANALASIDLGRRQALQDITEMTARAHHVNAPLGSFVTGDEVLVEAAVPWVGDVRLWQRIQSYTWSPESDAMRLSLRRSDSVQGG